MKPDALKHPSLPLVLAGAWILTIAAGFLAGRKSAPDPAASPDPSATSARHARAVRADHASASGADRRHRTPRNPDRAPDGSALDRLNQLLAEPSFNTRASRFLDYIARLSPDDFPLVAASLADRPMGEMHQSEYAMLISEWAARDPFAASEYFKENAKSDWERETVLSEWAARDPQSAFDWAASTYDAGKINNWVAGAMKGIATSDPELAARLLDAMDPSPTRDHSMRNTAAAIAALGPDRAAAWLSSISDAKLRQSAAWMIAGPLARADAPNAGNWVATLPDPTTRQNAAKVVAQRWARTDLGAARSWVDALPSDTRPKAAEGLAWEFGRNDPQLAANWLATLGNGPELDGARRQFLDASYKSAPETAANVVSSIADPKLREKYYYRVLGRWASRDRNAARAWVASNPTLVPPSLQKRLLR
jgi:hypothetical protein